MEKLMIRKLKSARSNVKISFTLKTTKSEK